MIRDAESHSSLSHGILAYKELFRPSRTFCRKLYVHQSGKARRSLAERVNKADLSSHSSPYFTTFWQLTLYDIVYPKERYDAELNRLRAMQREASLSTTLKPDEKDKFIKGVVELANRLTDEAVKHAGARGLTNRRLNRESKQWFACKLYAAFLLRACH